MSEYATLDGEHNVVPSDLNSWARAFDQPEVRRVAWTEIEGSTVHVSTVFLGLNHQWGDGPPLWFETMVFGGPADEHQWRWTTWAEAEAGHARIVAALTEGRDPDEVEAPG